RQVTDGRSATRQPVERVGDVLGEPRAVELEMFDDALQIGVLRLQDLRDPVHQLDIGVAAQLAEHRGAFDGLVGQAVELAEGGLATDLRHATASARASAASASNVKSSATFPGGRNPNQLVQPRRPATPSVI